MKTSPLLPEVSDCITTRQGLRIGGAQIDTTDDLTVINPSNGDLLTTVARAGAHEVNLAVSAAQDAFENGPWRRMTPDDRSRIIWRLADLIEENPTRGFHLKKETF